MSTIVWPQAATLALKQHYDFWETIDPAIAKSAVQLSDGLMSA